MSLSSLVFAISSTITAWLIERFNIVLFMTYIGIGLGLCFGLAICPPFLQIDPTPNLIFLPASLLGMSFGIMMPCAIHKIHKASKLLKFRQSKQTNVVLSSTWTIADMFGNFIGPFIGGFLVDTFGYRTTVFIFASCLIPIVIANIFKMIRI